MASRSDTAGERASRRHQRRRTANRRRIVLYSVLGILVVVVGLAAWVGVRGWLAKGELEAAVPLASHMKADVLAGKGNAAAADGAELQQRAAWAASLTSDPVWLGAESLPLVGPNLTVVRELAASVDGVAKGAVQPLGELAGTIALSDFKPVNGRVNLQPLVAAQPSLAKASATLTAAQQRLSAIDSLPVVGPLAEARATYAKQLTDATDGISALNRAVQLIPPMLGAGGPRNYLVLFQNNAELRSNGGIPGALALLHADDGTFNLTQQASSADFPKFVPPVMKLPFDTRALWGDNTASYMQDITFTPQFPLTGQIAREMWRQKFGVEVDGVLSADPVVLSHLLVATGPITLPSGDVLTSENAVQLLLSDVYARYPNPKQQDAFFASAAASVFSAVASGNVDPIKLIDALAQSGEERRVFVWSAHAEDQKVLTGTTLAGDLPATRGPKETFGIYLDDETGSKMDTYLDVSVKAAHQVCRNDRLPYYEMWVTLKNTAPADAATSLPEYVTGGGDNSDVPVGGIRTTIAVYGPPGSYNQGVMKESQPTGYHPTVEKGYTLSKVSSQLMPGESATFQFGFIGGDPQKTGIGLEITPLLRAMRPSSLALTCESALF
ncbi:DUF4012 domain-containing protein [Rathayibacter sp. YIM 133350]|uniref:DUF4012 domain-containing protein n=1 Tax=Rathayibacter sp. YIM 133350 TaxID=3131992 RepID=UPI00307D4241